MLSILLASYNGEQFIKEQIDSLLNQTVQDFKLFICDDKSTDLTFYIVREYVSKYPDKIFVSETNRNTGSPKHNFINLMIEHKDDYIMLCDQDDVWMPDKIEKSLNKIQEMERILGVSVPLLVHSDLTVTNKNLETIYYSFIKAAKAQYDKTALKNIIIQNILTGCTAIYNRALAQLIFTEPDYMIMHDWWLVLIASAFGNIGTICEPTILYRQHEDNDSGANRKRPIEHIFYKIFNFNEVTGTLINTYRQANSFLSLYSDRLTTEQKTLVEAYVSIPQIRKIERLKVLFKYGIWKNGIIRKIAQIMAL